MPLAVTTSPSSGAAPGDELARVRRQLASARELDGLVHAGGDGRFCPLPRPDGVRRRRAPDVPGPATWDRRSGAVAALRPAGPAPRGLPGAPGLDRPASPPRPRHG